MAGTSISVGDILDQLAKVSKRPRYAFMVLNLLAEQASDRGKVGPTVAYDRRRLPLREWIGERMASIGEGAGRRQALEDRVREELRGSLPMDLVEASTMIDEAVRARVRKAGADNFSRVVADLEKAGYLKRFYEGRITDHENRGGRRQLVCVLDGDALAAIRRRDTLI